MLGVVIVRTTRHLPCVGVTVASQVTKGALLRWWNASRVVSASFRSQKWLRMGRRNPDAVRGDCADHRQLLVHGLGTAELMRACAEGTARRNSGDGCSYRRLGTS